MSDHDACWVPIPLRWRHVLPGDVIVGKGKLLMVQAVARKPSSILINLHGHAADFRRDPDETVSVLVPFAEREALVLLRTELGARVIERKG